MNPPIDRSKPQTKGTEHNYRVRDLWSIDSTRVTFAPNTLIATRPLDGHGQTSGLLGEQVGAGGLHGGQMGERVRVYTNIR